MPDYNYLNLNSIWTWTVVAVIIIFISMIFGDSGNSYRAHRKFRASLMMNENQKNKALEGVQN